MNFSKAERVNLPDSNESQYVVDYDFRLFSTGEFATWFYGTGPHSFSDSIVFELMRVERPTSRSLSGNGCGDANPRGSKSKRQTALAASQLGRSR